MPSGRRSTTGSPTTAAPRTTRDASVPRYGPLPARHRARRRRATTRVRETAGVADLLSLSSDLPVLRVRAGEVLIEEGARPERLLVLIAGAVVVEHDGVAFARIDSPGSVFGEMSAVLGRPA